MGEFQIPESKFKFVHTYGDTNIVHEFAETDLDQIIEQFESFLKGCGFQFKGTVDILLAEETDDPNDD